MNVMVHNLMISILNMSKKEEGIRQLRLKNCGKLLLKVKLKQEHLTCFLKIMQILNQTNRILVQLRVQTFVAKS